MAPASSIPLSPSPVPSPEAPRPAQAFTGAEDDPETLLRQYADRQKARIARLERQVGDLQKAALERDTLKAKSEALARELLEARRQIENVPKQQEAIKDLQHKLDAALLSNGMAQSDNAKLKMRVQELEGRVAKAEERAAQAEKRGAETEANLQLQTQARQEMEGRITAALAALQLKSYPPKK